MSDSSKTPRPPAGMSSEKYARLQEEARAPYRGLRMFLYLVFGSSGFVGGVVFLAQILAGRDVMAALPNFALQAGVVALMVWLAKVDRAIARKEREKNNTQN